MKLKELKIDLRIKSPQILCNPKTGEISLNGRSIMENAFEFYKPLNEWLMAYIASPAKNTTINIKLEYINSGSRRTLFPILKQLTKIEQLKINWYFPSDDPDIEEIGLDYKNDLGLPIKLIGINPDEF